MRNGIKTVLIMALLAIGFAVAINGIDNPKPSKLAATITREIKKVTQ